MKLFRWLPLLIAGCAIGEGRYVESRPCRRSYDDVFRITREEIETRYAVLKADPVAGKIETRWDTQMGVFKESGNRRRVRAKLETLPNGLVRIRLQVPVEVNSSIHHTLIENEADWGSAGFDETEEQVLLQRIYLRLATTRPPENAPENPRK